MAASFVCIGEFIGVLGTENDGVFKGTPEQIQKCNEQLKTYRIREFVLPEGMVQVGDVHQAYAMIKASWERSPEQISPERMTFQEREDSDGHPYIVKIIRKLHVCPWTNEKWMIETEYL